MNKENEIKYAEIFSKWYSWGSPVGLGIFLISIAITIRIIFSTYTLFR